MVALKPGWLGAFAAPYWNNRWSKPVRRLGEATVKATVPGEARPTVRIASTLVVLALGLGIAGPSHAEDAKIVVPPTPGLEVQVGEAVAIPGAESSIAHRFNDGRIVVAGK